MHDASGMLPIPGMERTLRCLLLLLGLAGLGCASDYTESYRLAHPGWAPAPPRAGDSFEETVASIHARPEGSFDVSVRELRVLRVDSAPWETLSVDSAAAEPEEWVIGAIALRRCKGRRGIRFFSSERVEWYIFAAGGLISYDHFEFGEGCETENHYLPSRAEHLTTERALIRYAASRYPDSVPTTAEMLSKGLALVAADRLSDAERMLRSADRELDSMAREGEDRPEEEREAFAEEEKQLRAMRAKLSRAIAAAQRQQRAD
jgi:hypothetical protein